MWRLRALIECMREGQGTGAVDDIEAAIAGCVDLADIIHSALAPETLAARAAEIEEEAKALEAQS